MSIKQETSMNLLGRFANPILKAGRSGLEWWAMVFVSAFVLAACGAGTVTSGDSAALSGPGSTSPVTGGSPSTAAGDGIPQFGSEEFGLTMEQLAARVEQVEGLVGDCMREAGFEYVPVDFVTVRQAMTADKSAPGLSDDEFRSQYGYGISTQKDKPTVAIGFGEQNLRIFDNLSSTDQVAYNQTLYGEDQGATFAATLEAEDFSTTGGCTSKAVEASFTPEELSSSYFNPGDRLLEQDPRVVSAIAAWAECIRQSGFDYNHPDEIEDDIRERFLAITEGQDPTALTGSSLDALLELAGEEKAVAQNDFDCASELLDPVVEAVEAEIYGAPQG
jgi:hypothetical protein